MTGKESTIPASSKPAKVRQKVHIRIGYKGKGQPGKQLTERCDTLVDLLVEADAGMIEGRKSGDGAVDIYVVTRFAGHTIEQAQKIVNELGIATRATIEIVDNKKAEGWRAAQGTQGEPRVRESYGTLASMTAVVPPSARLKPEVER
jgi:hypothetical protein